jgi:hypothetical protein
VWPITPPILVDADYTLSWTVHGLLEASVAGNGAALPLIRRMMDYFNNHTSLPSFLVGGVGWGRVGVRSTCHTP